MGLSNNFCDKNLVQELLQIFGFRATVLIRKVVKGMESTGQEAHHAIIVNARLESMQVQKIKTFFKSWAKT